MRRTSIYDKNLKQKKEVSESAFLFLFSEMVQYCLKKDKSTLAEQLEELGYPIGPKFLELLCFRDKGCKKELKIVEILFFISKSLWPCAFNKTISSIEQHAEYNHMYMLKEENSLCNRYACLHRGQKSVNCSAFAAGLVEGLLNAAGFSCRVIAYFDSDDGKGENFEEKTTYVIYFAPEIVERDAKIPESRSS